ncbi:hypothetical protein ON010_g18156 [Phytophthora cinnamomi]|nr:hypothetical protein ON010_g18156 [Phytophthora cinnamomi]
MTLAYEEKKAAARSPVKPRTPSPDGQPPAGRVDLHAPARVQQRRQLHGGQHGGHDDPPARVAGLRQGGLEPRGQARGRAALPGAVLHEPRGERHVAQAHGRVAHERGAGSRAAGNGAGLALRALPPGYRVQGRVEAADDPAGSGITGPANSSITSSNINGAAGPFFPLLVRGMRLASTLLCHFADCLDGECALVLHALLEIIATGTYTTPDTSKSPPTPSKSPDSKFHAANAIANFKEAKNFLTHSSSLSTSASTSTGVGAGINFVTWPVLLSLEVLNRVCLEPDMVAAMQFFMAVRVAASCQCNMAASVFELSRSTDNEDVCEKLAKACVAVVAPAVIQSMNCVMRHCREVDLVTMSLKSYHVLATVASRLRANMQSQSAREAWCRQMDEVVLTCLRALCGFSFPLPDGIRGNSKGSISTTGPGNDDESVADDGESCIVMISWREVHAMKALFGAAHVMEEELSQAEWCVLLEGFEIKLPH